jgi:hypothetical protein
MRRPARARADTVAYGELPALSRSLTVAAHVVVDVGTSGRIRRRTDAGLSVAKLGTRMPLPNGAALRRAVGGPASPGAWSGTEIGLKRAGGGRRHTIHACRVAARALTVGHRRQPLRALPSLSATALTALSDEFLTRESLMNAEK